MRMKSLLGVALGAMMFASAPLAAAELVVNGGFEDAVELAGWTHTANHLHTFNGTQAPHSGQYDAAFGSGLNEPDSLSQVLSTVAGTNYTISFWVRNDGTPAFFSAAFDGVTLLTLNPESSFDYQFYSFDLTASTAQTTLLFMGANPPDHVHLDDVSVVGLAGTVPEPATWALMIGGFGMTGAAMRRRQRVVLTA